MLLPVVLQITLLLVVWFTGNASNLTLQTQRQELQYAVHFNRVVTATVISYGYLFRNLIFHDSDAQEKGRKFKDVALKEVKLMNDLPGSVPEIKEQAAKMTSMTLAEFERIERLSTEGTESLPASLKEMKSLRRFLHTVLEQENDYIKLKATKTSKIDEAILHRQSERKAIGYLVFGSLFVNLVFATMLMMAFLGTFANRMRYVVENAIKLPRGLPLSRPLPGTDEIGHLDAILHAASDRLTEASRFRKHVMEMVAHDLRSPLTSVNVSLDVVASTGEDRMSNEWMGTLENAIKNIEQLIGKVNDLIDVEKLSKGSNDSATLAVDETGSESDMDKILRFEFFDRNAREIAETTKFKPALLGKGMFLIVIPLIVSSAFLVAVSMLNDKMLTSLVEEQTRSEIAVSANRMTLAGVAAFGFMANSLMYSKDSDKALGAQYQQIEFNETKHLKELAKNDPSLLSSLEEIEKLTAEQFAKMPNFEESPISFGMPDPSVLRQSAGAFRYGLAKEEKLLSLANEQIERLSAAATLQDELSKQMEFTVVGGITSSIVLALLFLALLSRDVNGRMRLLIDNADRLRERKALHAERQGSDEIWYLDFVLHNVSARLDALRIQRLALVELVADELREPLLSVQQSLARLNAESTALPDVGSTQLAVARSGVDRMLLLIDDLLIVENLETGKLELSVSSFDLNKASQAAIDAVSSIAQKRGVALRNDCQSMEVSADRNKVLQILVNYLTNAINHSPSDSVVCIESRSGSNYVELIVVDSGPGLKQADRAKVFDRFYQTGDSQSRESGHGLGLAICKLIATTHGGSVGVNESPAGGCAFWVRIPR